MQSLGNLNSVSGNSITFSAVENVVVPEGPSVYTARVPTWEAIRKLGNVSGNGFSITQNFTLLGNMAGNVTFSVDSVSNVTYSIVGNSVSINNIRSVQDYLGTRLNVTIGNDVFGNFSHQGNVINTNSGNNFQYDINVLVPNSPEFNTANLANIAYDFFGSNVSNLNNIVTDISNSAPRVVTFNQPAGNANVTITSQDATAFISLNTTSTVPITKTFSTANGNGVMSLAGTRDDINSHLSTLTMTKNYSETTTGNITLYTGGSISSTQVKFGTNSFKIANATFPSSGYQASGVTYDLANANDFCAECWVRMSGFAASGDVDIFEVGNKAGFRIQWDTFAVKTWFYYGSSTIDAGFTLTPNTWSHVAIERVGNIVYFYANGSRSATSLTITTQTVTGGNAFYIGGPNNFGSDVYVDEFRISGQSRYYDASSSSYTVPSSAFTFDSGTYQLAHFEDTTNQYFSTITPNRSVRQISYAYSGASGPILETVSANYYAAFEDPIHVGNDVNYQKVGMPGWLYGTTSAYGGSGQESVRPHKITYAGRHPATGEPHFAYPFTTDAGNVAVKIYGLRTTSAAVIPGPLYDLGVANSATPQVTTSIVSGNAYTQANTVILLGTSVAGKTGNLGCDAGDYTSVAHTPLLSYNAITPDYSTIYSLNFPSGSFAASYRCANDTFQGASVVTANTVGTGTKHSITRYQTRTNVSGNIGTIGNSRSQTDYYSTDLYGAFPTGWNIPHHESTAYSDYYLTWNFGYTIDYPGNVTIPRKGFDLKKLNFNESKATTYFAGNIFQLRNATETANCQILFRPEGQRGQLFHVDLNPQGANTAGTSITMWRGASDLNTSPVQEVVHLQTVAHGGGVANTATSLAFLKTGNIGNVYSDRNLLASTPTPTPTGTTHTFTSTTSGNTITAVAVANTLSIIDSTSLKNNNPPLWLQRGLTYTFRNGSSAPTNLGNISVPANVVSSSTTSANGTITFTVANSAPDFSNYDVAAVGTSLYGGGVLNIYTGNTSSTRWSTVIPGAVTLVRGNATTAYMVYTKYTGAPTGADGYNSSAGLYYRSLTVDGSYNITWGTPVTVQDPAQTGNIYGASMAGASTTIDNATYVFCAISPNSNPTNANSTPTLVGIKIT